MKGEGSHVNSDARLHGPSLAREKRGSSGAEGNSKIESGKRESGRSKATMSSVTNHE